MGPSPPFTVNGDCCILHFHTTKTAGSTAGSRRWGFRVRVYGVIDELPRDEAAEVADRALGSCCDVHLACWILHVLGNSSCVSDGTTAIPSYSGQTYVPPSYTPSSSSSGKNPGLSISANQGRGVSVEVQRKLFAQPLLCTLRRFLECAVRPILGRAEISKRILYPLLSLVNSLFQEVPKTVLSTVATREIFALRRAAIDLVHSRYSLEVSRF